MTLAFLFFLRGLTEVCFRLINQSTQISGLPDYKQDSWFAAMFGGQSFGWLYDLWFALGGNLNRSGEQWVTGFDARAPRLPRPRMAVPLEMTATRLPLAVRS